jgi:hypothetical protein
LRKSDAVVSQTGFKLFYLFIHSFFSSFGLFILLWSSADDITLVFGVFFSLIDLHHFYFKLPTLD